MNVWRKRALIIWLQSCTQALAGVAARCSFVCLLKSSQWGFFSFMLRAEIDGYCDGKGGGSATRPCPKRGRDLQSLRSSCVPPILQTCLLPAHTSFMHPPTEMTSCWVCLLFRSRFHGDKAHTACIYVLGQPESSLIKITQP